MEDNMAVVGYRRTSSSLDQKLDRQDLGETDKVFEEKLSGKSASDRPALQAMLDYVGGGGGIRTHGTLSRTPVFKTGAFDHSATPPGVADLRGPNRF
jgi:hypothetical protein